MIISCARHSTQGNGNTVAITVLLQLHHTRKVVKVDAWGVTSIRYSTQFPVTFPCSHIVPVLSPTAVERLFALSVYLL